MSKIALSGNASGTGTLTIAAPNTNSNYTLTIPGETGTLLTSASNTNFPAGSVLQVVQAIYSTEITIATSTFTDTGLSASITPTSSANKILVLINQAVEFHGGNTVNLNEYGIQLLRDSTVVWGGQGSFFIDSSEAAYVIDDIYLGTVFNYSYMDSPATTSSVTYKTQGQRESVGGSPLLYVQPISRSTTTQQSSSIILMEIAA